MIFFIIDLLGKSRTPQKDQFLKEHLKELAMLVVRHVYSLGGMSLPVADCGELKLTQSGNVTGLSMILDVYHKSISNSWAKQWRDMFASNDLSSAWSAESLPILDVVMFAVTVVKFRRAQQKAALGPKTLLFLGFLVNALAKLMETVLLTAVVDYMHRNDVYRADIPSRQLRPGVVDWTFPIFPFFFIHCH